MLPPRTIAAGGLVLAAAILGGVALVAGGTSDSDYFGPNMPTWARVPTTYGDPVYVGVLILHARPGDVVELESLVVDGLEGDASVEPMTRILNGETRTLGGIAASDLEATIDISTYTPLATLRFSAASGPVELAVRVDGTTTIHGFNGLRLRFRVDGEASVIEDRIPMRASICTGATRSEAVGHCLPIEQQMHSFGL